MKPVIIVTNILKLECNSFYMKTNDMFFIALLKYEIHDL